MQRTRRSDGDPELLGTLSGSLCYKTFDATLPPCSHSITVILDAAEQAEKEKKDLLFPQWTYIVLQ